MVRGLWWDRHVDWSRLSTSISYASKCVHSVFFFSLYGSHCLLQYFALPNPVQLATSPHPYPPHLWALFRNVMREKQTERRWRLSTVGGQQKVDRRKKTVKTVAGAPARQLLLLLLLLFFFRCWSSVFIYFCFCFFYCTFCCKLKRNKAKFWITSFWVRVSLAFLYLFWSIKHTLAHTHAHILARTSLAARRLHTRRASLCPKSFVSSCWKNAEISFEFFFFFLFNFKFVGHF